MEIPVCNTCNSSKPNSYVLVCTECASKINESQTTDTLEAIMELDQAVNELRGAINYLDKQYSCDDHDINCPNPDGLAIALSALIAATKNTSPNKRITKCPNCKECFPTLCPNCKECFPTLDRALRNA